MTTWMNSLSCLSAAVFALGAASCAGNNLASELAKPPEFQPEGQATCKVGKSYDKPLIVEWPSGERTDLEARARQGGIVVVRYEGCEMRLLPRCKAPGAYAYIPVTTKEDTITIRDQDELYTNIPAGAAKLEAKLASAGQLNVAMTIVGKFAADRGEVRLDELDGSCAGATHIVVGMNVGAFEFFAGADAEIGAGVSVMDAGAGAKSRAKRETLSRDGDPAACRAASVSDETPPAGCGASLRLEVLPLDAALEVATKNGPGPRLACPAGTDLVDGACQPKVSTQCPEGMRFQAGQGCIPEVVQLPTAALPTEGSPSRGPAGAPVVIQWFGEYQDPFTKRVDPTLVELEKKFPGKIRVVFRHAPLDFHKDARRAAYAAIEAYAQKGDDGFWRMHALLLGTSNDLSLANLEAAAREVGLDLPRFQRAIASEIHKKKVDDDFALFNAQGFRGVPSFNVGKDVLIGAQSIDRFEAAVARALRGEDGKAENNPNARPAPEGSGKAALDIPADAPARGPANAPVVIQWFGAFQEPFTAKVAPTVERLMNEFPGKIRLVWRNNPMPFHLRARPAAQVALEAHRQGRFWDIFPVLIENRGALEDADLLAHTKQLRLDVAAAQTALSSGRYDAVIDRDLEAAKGAGVRGVPTFFVNGEILSGAQSIDAFRAAVTKALAAR